MEFPDVNVLIYAHREDAPEHDKYAAWLSSLAEGAAPFALSSVTLSGFLRIVTNPRILQPATPMELALAFCRQLLARPTAAFLQPGALNLEHRWDKPMFPLSMGRRSSRSMRRADTRRVPPRRKRICRPYLW